MAYNKTKHEAIKTSLKNVADTIKALDAVVGAASTGIAAGAAGDPNAAAKALDDALLVLEKELATMRVAGAPIVYVSC